MHGPVSPKGLAEADGETGMHYVYILKSDLYNKYYTGQTDDVDRRLIEHNNGNSTHTSKYLPWHVVYKEEVLDKVSAVKREKYLKSAAGRRWLKKYARVAKLVDALP